MSVIAVHAVITPKPEHVDTVQAEMLNMVRASRQEAGNLRYDLLREEKDGMVRFHVQERYRDQAAAQAEFARGGNLGDMAVVGQGQLGP